MASIKALKNGKPADSTLAQQTGRKGVCRADGFRYNAASSKMLEEAA
jgi:hypothetical protein